MNADTDSLDRLLDASAPRIQVADELDATAMVRAAQREAVPRRKRRGYQVALGAALAAVLVGGAGAAVAGTVFHWAPWAQDPDIVYAFTLPSGRECEVRVQVLVVTHIGDGGALTSAVDPALTDHFRGIDAVSRVDMNSAIAEVRQLADANVVIQANGRLADVNRSQAVMSEDDVYAFAVNRGLGAVLHEEFDALGWSDQDWNTNMDLQCAPVGP